MHGVMVCGADLRELHALPTQELRHGQDLRVQHHLAIAGVLLQHHVAAARRAVRPARGRAHHVRKRVAVPGRETSGQHGPPLLLHVDAVALHIQRLDPRAQTVRDCVRWQACIVRVRQLEEGIGWVTLWPELREPGEEIVGWRPGGMLRSRAPLGHGASPPQWPWCLAASMAITAARPLIADCKLLPTPCWPQLAAQFSHSERERAKEAILI